MSKRKIVGFRFLNRDEIPEKANTLFSSYEGEVNSKKIVIAYKYHGEPNYDRVQLRLELRVNDEDFIDKLGIKQLVELPYQYPCNFDLYNSDYKILTIPHSKGIYLLNVDTFSHDIITYQTGKFRRSYFFDDNFILHEESSCKIVNLLSKQEKVIDLSSKERIRIEAIQFVGAHLLLIIRNNESQTLKARTYNLNEYSLDQFEEFEMSLPIKDEELISTLRFKNKNKLIGDNPFRYRTIIDSWRYSDHHLQNRLTGRITYFGECYKSGDYFFRTEHYDYIELLIK